VRNHLKRGRRITDPTGRLLYVRRRHGSKNFADGAFNHLDDRVIPIANSTSKAIPLDRQQQSGLHRHYGRDG